MHRKLLLIAAVIAGGLLLGGNAQAAENPNVIETKPDQKHIVSSGESLSTIATDFKLESWVPIWNANESISNPDLIFVGQELTIPGGETRERPIPDNTVLQKPSVTKRQVAAPKRAANYAAGSPGVFARIRQLESGGNYATNTGNGYYGAYQFDLGTWRGVGGTGLPSDASPAEQDMRAQILYSRRGCSPWPNTCF